MGLSHSKHLDSERRSKAASYLKACSLRHCSKRKTAARAYNLPQDAGTRFVSSTKNSFSLARVRGEDIADKCGRKKSIQLLVSVLNNIQDAGFKDLMAKVPSKGQVEHGAPAVCRLEATGVPEARLSDNLRCRR